jgi:hypothetical protein
VAPLPHHTHGQATLWVTKYKLASVLRISMHCVLLATRLGAASKLEERNKMLSEPSHSKKKNAIFIAITVIGAIFFLEVLASWALILRMRLAKTENFTKYEPTYFSLFNIPYRAGAKFGFYGDPTLGPFEYRITTRPNSQHQLDPELGYKELPGKYQVIFSRRARNESEWKRLFVNETINHDGTRWTGKCEPSSSINVYIFGGSNVHGFGVNDEQTFAFLFQQARKDMCIKLFAVNGYGLTQSFIKFHQLVGQIKSGDIIILGYEDYIGERNVVAPTWLRETRDWFKSHDLPEDSYMLPKAALDAQGKIRISYVQRRCDENGGYCDREDPTEDEMNRITAALINEIAKTSSAPVYLLHLWGSKNTPFLGLLSDSVHRISALPEDFDYVSMDSVMGFDPQHPGPYWHYAISRKLIETFTLPIRHSGYRRGGNETPVAGDRQPVITARLSQASIQQLGAGDHNNQCNTNAPSRGDII